MFIDIGNYCNDKVNNNQTQQYMGILPFLIYKTKTQR